jgi:aryl-alcohol dehydrogenase-like predicted oxidoreductase
MGRRKLGGTNLDVSAFGMGCGNFGGIGSAPEFFGQGESEAEAFALLDRAVELGINYLDTADAYGGGRSEMTIGKWLKTKGSSVREGLLISSKVANSMGDDLDDRGLSRQRILRQIDSSLDRLGIDHLDMYLTHEPDPSTPISETLETFNDLVLAGKIRFIGASNFTADMMSEAADTSSMGGYARFEWVQNSFNLIDKSDSSDLLTLCRNEGLGFTPFSPLCGGWLTGKYRFADDYPAGSRMTLRPEPYMKYWNDATFAAIDRLRQAAADCGVSPAGLALGWLHGHPDITSSIVGPRRPQHFDPIEEALGLSLTADQWREIGSIFSAEAV